ncbi:hypothetical protein IscW_ISCW003271 [Ixodes scapularis]|uniref:Uncharacterized protein n=1 Tax=Ixodes scapularis TaxID=6945 RepID=B7P955_IXOSC|nr:hypothetical protein IscW_ISCW003271 [Ixodes scapularis]|eukprot:XP_002403610.1 hypothetical protein IscW_ISCW003271 [Ixodes scapularis]
MEPAIVAAAACFDRASDVYKVGSDVGGFGPRVRSTSPRAREERGWLGVEVLGSLKRTHEVTLDLLSFAGAFL